MKRWLVGFLLVVLAGVLLVVVIDSNRDPIAVLEEWGARGGKRYGVKTITRNDKGEVVEVFLHRAYISPPSQQMLYLVGLGHKQRFLSDAELVHLKGLTSLKSLVLGGDITDAGLGHLKGLTKLQTLGLEGRFSDAGLVHLKGLADLKELKLASHKVTDAGLVHLKGLTKLQSLGLLEYHGSYPTKVTNAGLVHLKGLSNLQELYLGHATITSAGLVHLKELTNLQKLWLPHGPISTRGSPTCRRRCPTARSTGSSRHLAVAFARPRDNRSHAASEGRGPWFGSGGYRR